MIALAWLVAVAVGLTASGARAQDEAYPSRAVRIVAAAAPGGNPDVLARLLSQRLTSIFAKPFIVENAPGAGGVVAAKSVASSPPDGHTLMINDSGGMAINVAMNPDGTYDPLRDFTPVTALATVPTVLLLHPSVPAKTLEEFVTLAKSQPNAMSYGSAGPGSIHHLTMAIFAGRAGINLLHVPYRGGSALVNGLLTGEIQAGWSGIPNVIPLIEAGKLRALCVSVIQRSASLPGVPTCDELGFKGFDVATMLGLQAPPGLAPKLVNLLQSKVAAVLREPDMLERMKMLGIELQENGTAHYAAFMRADLARYQDVVRTVITR